MYMVNYRLTEGGTEYTVPVIAADAETALARTADDLEEMFGRPVTVYIK